jgi:hypothetical protein
MNKGEALNALYRIRRSEAKTNVEFSGNREIVRVDSRSFGRLLVFKKSGEQCGMWTWKTLEGSREAVSGI